VNIDQAVNLRLNALLSTLVAQKDAVLNSVIDVATAEGIWELGADERGRPVLTLRLRDQFNGQCSATFAPEELQNDAHLSSRLYGLKEALIRVGHWRGQIQRLFADIRQWCQNLPGGAYVQEEPIIIREERSGEYDATRLLITRDGHTLRVEPIATWIVGADGRVDLKGMGGPFTLLYSQQDGGWFYFPDTFPRVKPLPLTDALFLQLAEACLDG
jgi:hypothetical protein